MAALHMLLPSPAAVSTDQPCCSRTVPRCTAAHSAPVHSSHIHTQFSGPKSRAFLGSSSPCGLRVVAGAAQRRRRKGRREGGTTVRADGGDYYDILGVPRNADKKAIKSAYRSKARTLHPDVNKEPGAEDQFKAVSNAYEVLSDDSKRAIYDRYGEAGLKGGLGGSADGFRPSSPFDIFEQFFGGAAGFPGMGGMGMDGMGRRSMQQGEDGESLRVDIKLDFKEAVFGCTKALDVSRLTQCKTCEGSGAKPGTTPRTCKTCGGQGQVVQNIRTPLGQLQQITTCPDCGGEGQTYTPCSSCSGDGRVRDKKVISLRVPPGVDVGSRLRVRGEGNAGRRGGQPGDVYVIVDVREHPKGLRREDVNIYSTIDVPYVDAILGTTVKVDTVEDPVELKVPAGTQPGTSLLMAKRGVPRLGGSQGMRGDHIVKVNVTIPKQLSSNERRLVEELKDLQTSGAKAKAGRGWL